MLSSCILPLLTCLLINFAQNMPRYESIISFIIFWWLNAICKWCQSIIEIFPLVPIMKFLLRTVSAPNRLWRFRLEWWVMNTINYQQFVILSVLWCKFDCQISIILKFSASWAHSGYYYVPNWTKQKFHFHLLVFFI